jgi:hypothetical protein
MDYSFEVAGDTLSHQVIETLGLGLGNGTLQIGEAGGGLLPGEFPAVRMDVCTTAGIACA